MPEFYIYSLYRPWNGLPCYIGKGKGKRWLYHERLGARHYNTFLANIFKKAARLGLEVKKKKLYRSLTEQEALELEVMLIKKIGRKPNGPLVNLTDGGDGVSGLKFSIEARTKISIAHKGKVITMEQRAKMGRPMTDARRALLSAANKGKVVSQETRDKIRKARLGVKRPDISLSQLGRKFSPETKAKMRAAKLGKAQSPEHRAKRMASFLATCEKKKVKKAAFSLSK